jgi:hypothetical protein
LFKIEERRHHCEDKERLVCHTRARDGRQSYGDEFPCVCADGRRSCRTTRACVTLLHLAGRGTPVAVDGVAVVAGQSEHLPVSANLATSPVYHLKASHTVAGTIC